MFHVEYQTRISAEVQIVPYQIWKYNKYILKKKEKKSWGDVLSNESFLFRSVIRSGFFVNRPGAHN